jgi:hypothetical protein
MGRVGLQLSGAAMDNAAAMEIELRHHYSRRRRLHHQNDAD